ncbi:MAG TPA: chemotaxis protein CheA [Pyrinomonadaceae bacterium]|jgi:two-component system chemotaxis sensor kinase CheA|nr:chemotaxis protein CheA [Pyrinomonadaceae bacterium]
MDDQLLREFLVEAEDLVEVLYADIGALRARSTDGRARRELVGQMFRHVHTIKGSAAAAGLESTSHIAHEFETLLDGVRMGRVRVDEPVLEAFALAVEAIDTDLTGIARGKPSGVPHGLVERLRALAATATVGDAETSSFESLPESLTGSLSEYERRRLHESLREGARAFVVEIDFDLMTFDEGFRALSDALSASGEIISTLPGAGAGGDPDRIGFRIICATVEGREELAARVAPFGASLMEAGREEVEDASSDEPTARDANESSRDAPQLAPPASAASPSMLVRVPLDELDDLISATHELFTDTTGALELALRGDLARAERTELEIRAPSIRRRFFELEERLIEMRMVPVRQTLERAARAGASVARVSGRLVDFEIEGGEVRLDKSLADAVADPLLHLLRNAVDHGIETPDERRLAGKPERGRVRLQAFAEGSRVSIRVSDDGRGIDTARVARIAAERGIVAPDARVSEQQALRLIFRPGFSTAAELSAVSGRGVGLDVVEQSVEDAGGELRVWSTRGAGTTFEMRLPTTLALVSSLVVRSAENLYCVDASHIVEAGYLSPDEAVRADEQTVRWRGETIPFVQMRTLLGQRPAASDMAAEARVPVVISRTVARDGGDGDAHEVSGERVAVAVDGWDGHSEVLVRSLGRHATRWRGVSGATELSDGRVALMLDLPRLLEM